MPSKRKITLATVKAGYSTRKPATVKPARKPVAAASKPAAAVSPVSASKPASKPATVSAVSASPAKPVRGLTRGAALIVRAAYPFERLSDADETYLSFFASFAKASGGTVTLADTLPHSPSGITLRNNPARMLRLVKAGYFTRNADGTAFVATDAAKSHKLYTTAAARPRS